MKTEEMNLLNSAKSGKCWICGKINPVDIMYYKDSIGVSACCSSHEESIRRELFWIEIIPPEIIDTIRILEE